jgi:SRSO17 transposase
MSLLQRKEARLLLEDATLSQASIRGCRRRLMRFLQRYLPLFYRREQREHAELVVWGKLGNLQRKTCEPIARQAGVQRKPIQLFVGAGKWDDEAVMAGVRQHVAEVFADPDAVLVLDPSAFAKKGTASCGVERQWCGRLGKVENCQVGVFLACVSRGQVAPLDRQLYLPRSWAEDPARRQKTHVPQQIHFAQKWQIGLRLLKGARGVPHGWVTGDDEFGRPSKFRATLRRRRERYVLDVPCNTLVRVCEPGTGAARAKRKGPRPRGRPRKPPFVRVDQWAAAQPAAGWQRLELRAGELGPLLVEVLHAEAETRQGRRVGVRERLLVIRTVEANPKTHYCLSNAPPEVPWEDCASARMERRRVEEMFALGNGEVGLNHYEVRSWAGWHHHMTLSLLALWFLVLERQQVGEKNPGDHCAAGAGDLQSPAAASRAHAGADHGGSQQRAAA